MIRKHKAKGAHGAEGGRGHKKTSISNDITVSSGDVNARSTVGQIAKDIKTSDVKAHAVHSAWMSQRWSDQPRQSVAVEQ